MLPPAGAAIDFTAGSPNMGSTYAGGNGTYAVPNTWSLSHIKMKAYAVNADGSKGNLVASGVKAALADPAPTWAGTVNGLTKNT